MDGGVRATVSAAAGDQCPVAAASAATGTVVDSVVRSRRCGTDPGRIVEFTLAEPPAALPAAVEPVFAYESGWVYRVTPDAADGCPCTVLERHGCPIHDFRAEAGRVRVVFYAEDAGRVRAVVTDLRDRCEEVTLERLVNSRSGSGDRDVVEIDRSALTDRQRECLRTASRMGYYEHPREANTGEVAAELGISTATLAEHLAVAEGKLVTAVLNEQ